MPTNKIKVGICDIHSTTFLKLWHWECLNHDTIFGHTFTPAPLKVWKPLLYWSIAGCSESPRAPVASKTHQGHGNTLGTDKFKKKKTIME